MYIMGIPVTVTVDEYLLMWSADDDHLVYGQKGVDGALWLPILEKAAAKLFGNYEMLSGGWMGPAIQTLTGAPFYETYHQNTTADTMFTLITELLG